MAGSGVMTLRRQSSVCGRRFITKYKLIGVIVIVGVWFVLRNPAMGPDKVVFKERHLGWNSSKSLVNTRKDDGLQRMDKLHDDRRNAMTEACTGKEDIYVGNNSIRTVGDHLVVDRKHKIVYCGIEKVGSTFWRRVFQIIIGSSKSKSPFEIPANQALGGHVETFSEIAFDDAHNILESSRKFIFVRNPYTRLFSGYIDKLFSPNPAYWGGVGKYVIKGFRKNPSSKSLKCGHDVTFAELIKYFIHSQNHNKFRDGHFIPMYDHCRPCRMKYDFIGKMESFKQDSLYILQKLGFHELYEALTHFENGSLQDTISDQVNNLFGYSHGYKNCTSFHEALKRLWVKFQIRGFLLKNVKFPFSENETNNLTRTELIKKLTNVMSGQTNRSLLKKQKEQALIDAYQSVDFDDLRKLRDILQPDCDIFGYDCTPNFLFKRSQNKTNSTN